MSTDLIGTTLDERYVIEAVLGSGAMGVVYRARHVKIGRLVAVKVLHHHLIDTPRMVERFEREAHVAAGLRHQNLVGVLDVGQLADGRRTMVIEFANGPTLATLVKVPISEVRVVRMLKQLCDGLAQAHGLGLIHRDLKPENIVVERAIDGSDVPRIIDFGIAILRTAFDVTPRITDLGLVLGTPAYMAPEQATGALLDPRCDLYALGVIAYEMLAGRVPFEGSNVDIVHANLTLTPPPIATRAPGVVVDPLLEKIVLRLMAKQRDDRFATALAVRGALDRLDRDRAGLEDLFRVAVVEPDAPPPTAPAIVKKPAGAGTRSPALTIPPVVKPRRRRRSRARLAIAMAVVGIACAVLAFQIARRGELPPRRAVPVVAVTAAAPDEPIADPVSDAPLTVPSPPPPRPHPKPPTPSPSPIPAPIVPPPPIITPAIDDIEPRALVRRYVEVGHMLARATDAQHVSFRAIQLNDALATPESRRVAMKALDAIAAGIPAAP